jgi:F0F1-type ATP synthase assembly protein I
VIENDGRPNLWRYASAGMEFIITFGLLLGGGLMLDRWLKSLPAFTLVGALAGFAGGMMRLIKVGRDMQRDAKDAANKKDDGDAG